MARYHFLKKYFLLFCLLSLCSCATIPPLSFSVPNVGKSTQKIDAELKSLTVSLARPDEATGDIDVAGAEDQVMNMWKTSLQEALDAMLIFDDDSTNRVSLSVKVLKLDAPAFGHSMTTEASAKYDIVNRTNGDIVFTTTINSEGVCPFNYAFLGLVRARESVNRAVQNNILQFLQALESVDMTKPMFPADR